jgi:methylenetetrahydrofolate dehydrogenase (NADP+) / methenyltetrahydrofolate cyclohydrolase
VSAVANHVAASFLKPSGSNALAIDGKAVSHGLLGQIGEETKELVCKGITPGLAVVIVGEDPASQVYVRAKAKAAKELGFYSEQHDLPAGVSENELLALVRKLNADPRIHGILVQLPLPKHIQSSKVLGTIVPGKDVDGFHPLNVGFASIGETRRALIPCTPAGAMILIEKTFAALHRMLPGSEVVVIGRSNIVGKPMAQLLLAANCTVTVAHSRTRDLAEIVRRCDLVVAAVGQPELVRGDWIKPGAIVVDVGVNRVVSELSTESGKLKTRLVGDVAFREVTTVAAAVTPVPGGVGPMTIAMLMANTLLATCRAERLEEPRF